MILTFFHKSKNILNVKLNPYAGALSEINLHVMRCFTTAQQDKQGS